MEISHLRYLDVDLRIILKVKNAVFWDMTPCGSCKNRRFGGIYFHYHKGKKNQRATNNVSKN
jgi:hypothetical protein